MDFKDILNDIFQNLFLNFEITCIFRFTSFEKQIEFYISHIAKKLQACQYLQNGLKPPGMCKKTKF